MKRQTLPSLTVIVPVYNEAADLADCLDSLLVQANDIAEILIIDNNSTDGSYELAKQYANNYGLIRVASERRQGLVPTRNRGFKLARSDIVARIDADTRVSSVWALAIRRRFAEDKQVVAITGQTRYYDLPFKYVTAGLSRFVIADCNQLISGFASLYGPNMALRSRVAKQLARDSCGGQVNEDLDLTVHLHERDLAFGFEPATLADISGRRMMSSPVSFFKYLLNWPNTYWGHDWRGAAILTYFFVLPFWLVQAVLCLPLRAYDPRRYRLSWRRLVEYADERIIP